MPAWYWPQTTTSTSTAPTCWYDMGTGGGLVAYPYWYGTQTTTASTLSSMYWGQQAALNQQLLNQYQHQQAQMLNQWQQQQMSHLLCEPLAAPAIITRDAIVRADELLLEHLTPEQRETMQRHGWFVVEGGHSKKKYRIRGSNLVGNVDVMKGDKVEHRLCAHMPVRDFPMGDQLLAQKLMLECDEHAFLRVANRHHAIRV